ncbi:hypothetical protein CCICO_06310 [Corynebacterium ciconiae DSM 44920]|uniref:hypothetical protein n=1 Tax=Corynebacterium ciconiae TaxID=227319 RepID=UPI0003783E6E|nr:hypothetical protein [Corynebacterium ciconiae]WKD61289.1 hypothetical protein CCICO_06310 [Corynebacterium ciconiae DSM 44920]
MVDIPNLSQNATVGGTAAGLVVSSTLAFLSRKAKPPLELFVIDNDRAFLVNNCFRTVIFGDSFAIEKGSDMLFPVDGFRGSIRDMRCSPGDGLVVGCAINLGESLSLTFKPILWGRPKSTKIYRRQQNETQLAEVMVVLEKTMASPWTPRGIAKKLHKHRNFEFGHSSRLLGWKLIELPLKPR